MAEYGGGNGNGSNGGSNGGSRPRARGYVGSGGREEGGSSSSRSHPYAAAGPSSRPSGDRSVSEEFSTLQKEAGSHGRGGGGGRGGRGGGRGGMRGNRFLPEVVHTRHNLTVSKQGTTGAPSMLKTNYFRVICHENDNIFQYAVDFNPPIESTKQKSSLFYSLKKSIGGYLFDGMQLYSRDGELSDEYVTKDPQSGQEFVVRVRQVGKVDGTNEKAFHIYNLMNRHAMAGLKLQLIGRSFFDPEAKITIRQFGLELYPGYVTSIRQHERDVLMCVELNHRVMRMDTCYQLFQQCRNQRGDFRDNYKRMVLGMVIMTTYGKNNTHTISDVDFDITPESSFDTKAGPVTFMQYFKDRYNVTIRDPRQPMLVSRARPREIRAGMPEFVLLVPELSRITGISDEMKRDFQLMRAMADHTRLNPDRRIERLETFNRRLRHSEESSEVFKFWKTELDRRLVEVPARTLDPEIVYFHPDLHLSTNAGDFADWQQAFRNNPMYLSVELKHWYVLVPRGFERQLADFMQCLVQVSRQMHFRIEDPRRISLHNDSPVAYVEQLSQIVLKDPQLVMCLVANDKVDRYAAIKKKCYVERAIPTQIMKTRTVTPKGGNVRTLMSVATKVAIQMNCKLGGIPWIVKSPLASVMVIGFDITKDSKDKSKAFGSLVATMYGGGVKHPKYFSTINQHSNGEEFSNFMALNVLKAIRVYQAEFHGTLPLRIIIYRDGVGEGQLKYVYEHEVNIVKEKLEIAYKGQEQPPRLTFFVINKRINTRLFYDKRNPGPGTVVDDIITMPERNDFFLVSQNVRQGTVSPTAYNILCDESGLNADRLQIYTFKQTHMYFNWAGTVCVPAVCQYAHKLCFMVTQFLHQTPNSYLEKKLYYL